MLNAIGMSLTVDEEKARSGLEMFIDITAEHSKFFKPQIQDVVQAMVEIATNDKLEASTRQLGLDLLVELSEKAPGMMKKVEGMRQCVCASVIIE